MGLQIYALCLIVRNVPKPNGEVVESETRQKVRQLLEEGVPVREIARVLDLSTQRVYQQVWAIRAKDGAA